MTDARFEVDLVVHERDGGGPEAWILYFMTYTPPSLL
jgi:hypothetical protein